MQEKDEEQEHILKKIYRGEKGVIIVIIIIIG